MTVNISNHEYPGIWDKTYYYKLSDYPNLTHWELKQLILFFEYEKKHGRKTEIICENKDIIQAINNAFANPELYLSTKKPDIITSCSANKICNHKGCLTDYLCHGTSIESAKLILKCGKLLSTVKVKNKTAEELAKDEGDPPDYFEYIMMSWGNCIAGDSLVMERMLGRFPSEHEFNVICKPGVRFYFEYESIENHKNYANDGYHPAKIKDEIILSDYLHCCIIPEHEKMEFENIISSNLINKVFYIKNDCKDIWDWTAKVYDFVLSLKRRKSIG